MNNIFTNIGCISHSECFKSGLNLLLPGVNVLRCLAASRVDPGPEAVVWGRVEGNAPDV